MSVGLTSAPTGPTVPVSRPNGRTAQNDYVINEAELLRMTPDERRQLAHALAAIDLPHPLIDPRLRRRRRFGLLFMMACCLGLAAWIAILIVILPERYTSSDWRAVWIGLDIFELAGFAATAWAAWHQRQVLIFFMVITGTLLVCDAWFDLALSYGSSGFTMSVVSAVLAEFPLAFMMFAAARRLVRVTVQSLMHLEGVTGPSSLGNRRSRGENRGYERLHRIPPADVLDRLPDDRQRQRRRGHRAIRV